MAIVELDEFKTIQLKKPNSVGREVAIEGRQCWKMLDCSFYKANFDAAFDKGSEKMGIGIVIIDRNGDVLATLTTSKDKVGSVFHAKCYALSRALRLCEELGMEQVLFKGDAKSVVHAINSRTEDNSWMGQVIEYMKSLLPAHDSSTTIFSYRDSNVVAHTLAKLAMKSDAKSIWLGEGPKEILSVIVKDKYGIG
ncbi:uncharacterized protein LOC122293621 [Carya illinoinensis]|uniref:uncharacterized protein LOC122293621 n=1 Tax=Carya illinoinensis TaxID=32201 RepID=UPI001C726E20|nr:uncharacterized protein LOC122293621 [Carya illinoinensis]